MSSPRLFLFLSETPERLVKRASRAERPFTRDLLSVPAERGSHPRRHRHRRCRRRRRRSASLGVARARVCVTKYAIAIASVRQARRHAQERTLRSDAIPDEGHTRHTRTRRGTRLTCGEESARRVR